MVEVANGEHENVIISTMGLRPSTAREVGLGGWHLIEWPGIVPKGSVHPSWGDVHRRFRDGKGDMIPGLLRHYGVEPDSVERLFLIGFSAGSNSGLRQLLKTANDRARVNYVFSIDGFHANRKPENTWEEGEPRSRYWDWQGEVEPLAAYARQAALGDGVLFASASDVAAPTATTTKTEQAWQDVWEDMVSRVPSKSEYLDGTELASFPDAVSMYGHKDGNALFVRYYGRDPAAHIAQANTVAPYFIREWLIPRYIEGTQA